MVRYKVKTTKTALDCIKAIHDYLQETASKQVAQRVYGGLFDEIDKLAEYPHRNTILRSVGKNRIYRRKLKWSYKIIYTIEEVENLVVVVYVAHEKQSMRKIQHFFE